MMLRRLLPFVPAGVVGGHLVGYALVDHTHAGAVPHAHLPLLALLALPLVVLASIRWIRRPGEDLPTTGHALVLAAAQMVGFSALETLERLSVAGPLVDPAVLAGLAVQALVAWALLRVVRTTALEADRLRRLPVPVARGVQVPLVAGRSEARRHVLRPTAISQRAPPHVLVA